MACVLDVGLGSCNSVLGINMISPIPSKFIFSLKLQKFAFSEIVWKLLIECLYCITILDNG